jgi:IS5 family transposase
MGQNYLHGIKGIQINALMSATAWNFKKKMEILKKKPNDFFVQFFQLLFSKKIVSECCLNFICKEGQITKNWIRY